MASTSIRIDRTTHQKIKDIAGRENKPIGEVVADAIHRYEDEQFWRNAHAGYQRLRGDPEAWKAYQNELRDWDVTLMDGLENEEPYYSPEELEDALDQDTQAGRSLDRLS